jgi:Ran GTPase-activating protein (RanGAP) involved in mRNA processing and transport
LANLINFSPHLEPATFSIKQHSRPMSAAQSIAVGMPKKQGGSSRFSFGKSKLKNQPSIEVPVQLNPLGANDDEDPIHSTWDRSTLTKATAKRQSLEQYNTGKNKLRLSVFKTKSSSTLKSVVHEDDDGDSDDGESTEAKPSLCCASVRRCEESWQRRYGRDKRLQMAGPAFDRLCIVADFLSDVAVLALIAEKKESNYGLYQFAVFLFFLPYVTLWLILYSPLLKLVKAFAEFGTIDAARISDEAETSSVTSNVNPAMIDGGRKVSDRKVSDRKDPVRINIKQKRTKAAERRAHTRVLIYICSGARIDVMFTVMYFFSGFVGFWLLDFTLATRYLCVEMEGRKSRWKENIVYYEKLRKLVECTCEAIPQILFQVYILFRANDAIEIDWRLLILSVCISVVVLLLRVREIRRGAHYRQITVREHMKQIWTVGVGEIPHLAGIGSGKLVEARYNDLRLTGSDMASVAKAMQCRTSRLKSLHLSSCNLELEHVKTLCFSLVRIAASNGGTLAALDLSHNEGIGFMGTQHIAAMLKNQRTNFHLNLADCAVCGVRSGIQKASKDWQSYSPDGIVDLAAAVENRSFCTSLGLRSNHLCQGGRQAALNALCSAIRYSQLSGLDLSQNDMDNDMVVLLADAVPHSLTLKSLDLRSNNFDADGANALTKAIGTTSAGAGESTVMALCGIPLAGDLADDAVTELSLSADGEDAQGRVLQVGGALLLAHYLRQPRFQQLQKLDLSANVLCYRSSTTGCVAVCGAIATLPITHLDLSANDIAVGGVTDGVAAVMKMVEKMAANVKSLPTQRKTSASATSGPLFKCLVDLSLNSLSKSQADSLDEICKDNEVKLVLSDDPRGISLDDNTTFGASSSEGGKHVNAFKTFEQKKAQSKMMAQEGDGGWLLKRSDRIKGLHKWERRQFVRRGRLLHYYADAQHTELSGLIDLTKILSVALSPKTKPPQAGYEVFKVTFVAPNPRITFAAPEGQAKSWTRRMALMKDAGVKAGVKVLSQGWLYKRGRLSSWRERYCCICRCSMRAPEAGGGSRFGLKPSGRDERAASLNDSVDVMLLYYMDRDLLELTGGIDLKTISSAIVVRGDAGEDDAGEGDGDAAMKAGGSSSDRKGSNGPTRVSNSLSRNASVGSVKAANRSASRSEAAHTRGNMLFKLVSTKRVYTFDCSDAGNGTNSVSAWITGMQSACPWITITDEMGSSSAAKGTYGLYKAKGAAAAGKSRQGKLGKGKNEKEHKQSGGEKKDSWQAGVVTEDHQVEAAVL